jgi:sugar O-acyltransferase (sialic acid O-acetyltransferase NeuD family)
MNKQHKLIVIGDSAFAEIAFEYFTYDSSFEVAAFAVEREYLTRNEFLGRPVVAFEDVQDLYSPAEHHFYAALVYTQQNKLRTRLYRAAKDKGYTPASYISPRAFLWRDVQVGEHCFIFEDNVVQPRVAIGNNVVLWSGNHIGHHSKIQDNCFISSHVVVSGFCDIGESCFLGVNATVANNVAIGSHVLVGAGALILADVPKRKVVVGRWDSSGAKPRERATAARDNPAGSAG